MAEGVTGTVGVLAGRYQIGERIGRGGMADVHVGTDARLGRRVAIKLLKPGLARDPAFRTRFRREAHDAAKMAHPTIVRVFDAGEETVPDANGNESQVPFIVMEFVDGRLLKDIIAQGATPVEEAVRVVEQVLTALEYSHRAGVVHRDIKPGNIMIATNGQVKVMDFGIARAISESSATIAETSAIVGTAQYFSPEQARGETVDARTDLYSTGIVLFELLTGQAPFRGQNPVAVAYQHVNQNPVAPSVLNPSVPPEIDAVVLRAMSKDRSTRFQSASEFRHDLDAAMHGEIVPVLPLPEQEEPLADFTSTLFGVAAEPVAAPVEGLRQIDPQERLHRTQTRPPVAWIWGAIATVAVIVIAVIVWTANLTPTDFASGLSVPVPEVTGQDYATGAAELESNELVPVQYGEVSDTVTAGVILRTVPEAGTNVGRQQVIKVYVSTGKTQVTVPQVSGFTLEAALEALAERNLLEGAIKSEDSPSLKKDVVIGTSPEGGTDAVEGDMVDIVVSTGRVEVPDVVGDSASEAGSKLSALRLDVQVSPRDCSGNQVTSQSLEPGSHPQGSEITIGVCSG